MRAPWVAVLVVAASWAAGCSGPEAPAPGFLVVVVDASWTSEDVQTVRGQDSPQRYEGAATNSALDLGNRTWYLLPRVPVPTDVRLLMLDRLPVPYDAPCANCPDVLRAYAKDEIVLRVPLPGGDVRNVTLARDGDILMLDGAPVQQNETGTVDMGVRPEQGLVLTLEADNWGVWQDIRSGWPGGQTIVLPGRYTPPSRAAT